MLNIKNININYIYVFAMVVFLMIMSFFLYNDYKTIENINKNIMIDLNDLSVYGYERENNEFINTIGDANIQFQVNQYLQNIVINFSEPLEQAFTVTVYYQEEFHDYDENYKSEINLEKGTTKADINVGKNIKNCRVDLGTNVNETFSLESIVLNENTSMMFDFKDWVICILFIVDIILILIVCFTKFKIEVKLPVIIFLVGLFYMITITPLSAPDEPHHYQSAYKLSNYFTFNFENADNGDSAYFDYSDLSQHKNVQSAYKKVIEEISSPLEKGENIEIPYPRNLSYFISYIPQAIGISLARITNQNFLITFYMGRLINLIFFAVCSYIAIKRTPKFKLIFGSICLFPMVIHQAASYSYDSLLNGISIILIASIIKAIYEEDLLNIKDFLYILISGMLLAPIKIVYLPIVFLALLIPKSRFKSGKDKYIKFLVIFGASVAFILLFKINQFFRLSGIQTQSKLNWEGQINYTFKDILNSPLKSIIIIFNTIKTFFKEWLRQSIGFRLSGLTLRIKEHIIWLFGALPLISAFYDDKTKQSTLQQRSVFVICFIASSLLIVLSMFLCWTSNTRDIILGVQGRYFIPILPLIPMVFSNKLIKYNIENLILFLAIILHTSVIIQILNYTI